MTQTTTQTVYSILKENDKQSGSLIWFQNKDLVYYLVDSDE